MVKRLSKDRPPYFDEKEVWQLRLGKFRFLYELIPGQRAAVVFFVGEKGRRTTQQMIEEDL
jgi:hypothetical protein